MTKIKDTLIARKLPEEYNAVNDKVMTPVMNAVLNTEVEANDVCIVDVDKIEATLKCAIPMKDYLKISSHNFKLMVQALAQSNCIKFKEK